MKYLLLIYSKKERWGILSLVLLNLVLILISFSYKHPSFEFTEASVIAFQTPKDLNLNKGFATRHTKTDSLFPFNPNEASKADLIALGFSERVAKNIVNYRSKGGQFYNTNALKKIYGMDSLFFLKIKEYCQIPSKKTISKKPFSKRFSQGKKKSKRFKFDPNTANKSQLISLGFSNKSANALLNYRSKGGRFYKRNAVKKIFGISASFYQSIEPFIEINRVHLTGGSQTTKKQEPKFTAKKGIIRPKNKKLEINSASQEEWENLPAIGPFHAKNIVSLRKKLGGFYDIHQIKESYRLTDSTFQVIQPYLIVDKRNLHKIDLQRSSFKEINRHPYITYDHTKLLMKAQREVELYSLKDLIETKIFNKTELDKLIPYLIFPEADYED